MADYIRWRLAAARLGVTMAFFALLGGLADQAAAATSAGAGAAPAANFLTDLSIPAGGLNRVVLKLDSALATLEHKLNTSFTTTHKLNQTFLKIKSANTSFLKIKSANTSFLKIDDANSEFLKVDSTAANANELGGLSPQAFFQGTGSVVTGAISSLAQNGVATSLLSVPGGIEVSIINAAIGAGGLQVQISNPSGAALAAVVNTGTGVAEHDLNPGTTSFAFATNGLSPPAGQLHIQLFPNAGLAEVVTIIISLEESTTTNPSFVGQAFAGPS
ncbi:MAG TPA: hypothetical protein VHX62_03725 [Solirubrobacteraceae bacterium]|jgi:hypothetical protein|nr:hypothetical protein [Solirubrobacteraceae bacterium]